MQGTVTKGGLSMLLNLVAGVAQPEVNLETL